MNFLWNANVQNFGRDFNVMPGIWSKLPETCPSKALKNQMLNQNCGHIIILHMIRPILITRSFS